MEMADPVWNNFIEGEPVMTAYSTSEETFVLPAPEIHEVDLSKYDSIFDAIDDLKVDWTPESFYRLLPEENQDGKEG